jgi:hypothetical protein
MKNKREKWYNSTNKDNKSGGKDKVKIEQEKSVNFQSSEGESLEESFLVLKQDWLDWTFRSIKSADKCP